MRADTRAGTNVGLQTTPLSRNVNGPNRLVSRIRHKPHNFLKVLAGKRRARIEPCMFEVVTVPIFRTCGYE